MVDCEAVRHTVAALDRAVRGNGKGGLTTRLAVMEQRVEKLEEIATEIRSFRRLFLVGVVGLFGSVSWDAVAWYLQHAA